MKKSFKKVLLCISFLVAINSIASIISVSAITLDEKIPELQEPLLEKQIEHMKPDFEVNPDDYEELTYADIMRDRSGKEDTNHGFSATIVSYTEYSDSEIAFAEVMRDNDSDQRYFLIFPTLPDQRLVEDDRVWVYGTLQGLVDYETVIGASRTAPVMLVDEAKLTN